jgi:hypothetical protein
MTRRSRTSRDAENRLAALESAAREEPPAEVRGVSVPWVSYDTDGDGDGVAPEFVTVEESAGK